MNRSYRLFVYETFENIGRIEEICSTISFYFSDIYDIEKSFGKRSKYATISKQTIFLAIERSKSLAADTARKIEILEENKIIKTGDFQLLVQELIAMIANMEKDYRNEKYEGIVRKLRALGEKCSDIKEKIKSKV